MFWSMLWLPLAIAIEARSRRSCLQRCDSQPLPPLFFSCFFLACYSFVRTFMIASPHPPNDVKAAGRKS